MQDSSSADYLSYYKEPWTTGWAVLHEYKGFVTRPELILYTKNTFFDFEKFVEIKKPVKDYVPKEITVTFKLI